MKTNVKQSLDYQIKECIKKISDEDLKYIGIRFYQRIGGDLSEALILIQNNYADLNKLLTTAINANELYNTIDLIDKLVQEALNRKSVK